MIALLQSWITEESVWNPRPPIPGGWQMFSSWVVDQSLERRRYSAARLESSFVDSSKDQPESTPLYATLLSRLD